MKTATKAFVASAALAAPFSAAQAVVYNSSQVISSVDYYIHSHCGEWLHCLHNSYVQAYYNWEEIFEANLVHLSSQYCDNYPAAPSCVEAEANFWPLAEICGHMMYYKDEVYPGC